MKIIHLPWVRTELTTVVFTFRRCIAAPRLSQSYISCLIITFENGKVNENTFTEYLALCSSVSISIFCYAVLFELIKIRFTSYLCFPLTHPKRINVILYLYLKMLPLFLLVQSYNIIKKWLKYIFTRLRQSPKGGLCFNAYVRPFFCSLVVSEALKNGFVPL